MIHPAKDHGLLELFECFFACPQSSDILSVTPTPSKTPSKRVDEVVQDIATIPMFQQFFLTSVG
jgi:hypothetical protein